MIAKLYWYGLECDHCGLTKEVHSCWKKSDGIFESLLKEKGWTIIKGYDLFLNILEKTFCSNKDCQKAAENFKREANE